MRREFILQLVVAPKMLGMSTYILSVSGMTCGHCKATVEGAATGSPGVSQATVDLDAGTVEVVGGEPSNTAAAISEAGYEATVSSES